LIVITGRFELEDSVAPYGLVVGVTEAEAVDHEVERPAAEPADLCAEVAVLGAEHAIGSNSTSPIGSLPDSLGASMGIAQTVVWPLRRWPPMGLAGGLGRPFGTAQVDA
jgi:hypothetical protein